MPNFHLQQLDLRPDTDLLDLLIPSSLFPLPDGKIIQFHLPRLELNRAGEFTDPIVGHLPSVSSAKSFEEEVYSKIEIGESVSIQPQHAPILPALRNPSRNTIEDNPRVVRLDLIEI